MVDDDTTRHEEEAEDQTEVAGSDLGQDVGVYLLDAATPEERADFERAADALPEVRAEAAQLAPVAVALGKIYELSPDTAPEAFDLSVEPSAELRGRILATAWADAAASPRVAPLAVQPEPEIQPPLVEGPASDAVVKPLRPQGRVRGGAPAAPIPIRRRELRTPWMAAAAMLVVAVGVVLWALALQNKIDNQNREMHAQATQIAQMRADANASAFMITGGDSTQPDGMLFYSPKMQRAVLMMDHIPAITDNSVYQLWYISGSNPPQPGAIFKPSGAGTAFASDAPSISTFDTVAITKEPPGGSKTPSMAPLMIGKTQPAAG